MNTTSKENRCISIFFLKKLSPFPLKLTKGSKNKRKNYTFTATKIGPIPYTTSSSSTFSY